MYTMHHPLQINRAHTLYSEYNRPTRVIGSAGHKATLEYIWAQLAQLGNYYTLSDQSFPAFSGSVYESRLVLGVEVIQNASAMSLTPPTQVCHLNECREVFMLSPT